MYRPGERGQCPHCGVTVLFEQNSVGTPLPPKGVERIVLSSLSVGMNGRQAKAITVSICPNCREPIVTITEIGVVGGTEKLIWPKFPRCLSAPEAVPKEIASDYEEACNVIGISPKASAALSRRCLQAVLKGMGYNDRDLSTQIVAALPNVPTYVKLDVIRNVGNFAAHPQKASNTGEILDVEPEEAEWNLKVLEDLFDFVYVKPAETKRKMDELNAKLAAVGKPQVKETSS